jgi:Xaa-Pro aminopeptidase
LRERGADWHFIATLDDIAWLFNLRGGDVSFNPVFVSFALINQQQATLFVALSKVDAELRAVLEQDGVTCAITAKSPTPCALYQAAPACWWIRRG